jgi:hypothetical protein
MKNVVFWDIETQFVLHRKHITSPLQSPASDYEDREVGGSERHYVRTSQETHDICATKLGRIMRCKI